MNKRKIILADDDEDDRLFFEDALREVCDNSHLTTANDGKELMTILDKTFPPPPDIIFLDLNMPGKNGFDCLSEIRNTDKYKSIPVVVLSTSSDRNTVDKVYKLGANKYLCKPGNFTSLKNLINSVLTLNWESTVPYANRENFLLTS